MVVKITPVCPLDPQRAKQELIGKRRDRTFAGLGNDPAENNSATSAVVRRLARGADGRQMQEIANPITLSIHPVFLTR